MEIYSKVISLKDHRQVRMTVSEFKGVEYLHFREYYQDFDEEWYASNKGIHIPLELETSIELFRGISEILSLAESKEVIENYFSDIIKEVYNESV